MTDNHLKLNPLILRNFVRTGSWLEDLENPAEVKTGKDCKTEGYNSTFGSLMETDHEMAGQLPIN